MVIMRVSSKSENAMLNTVRMLRRLLRNALLVTKRVKFMRLQKAHQSMKFAERDSQYPFALILRIKQRLRSGQLEFDLLFANFSWACFWSTGRRQTGSTCLFV